MTKQLIHFLFITLSPLLGVRCDPQCDEAVRVLGSDNFRLTCPPGISYVGHGSSGMTIRVLGPQDTPLVAKQVDLMEAKNQKRFKSEIDILERLKGHRGIIEILGSGVDESGKTGYLLLEMGERGSLEEFYIEEPGVFESPRFAVSFFLQLLETAQFIHDNQIVHADLKPENIVVSADRTPKMIDFGASVRVGMAGQNPTTFSYEDPARLRNPELPFAPTYDIYSLGVIFYRLLHDFRKPYQADPLQNLGLRDRILSGIYPMEKKIHWLEAFLVVKCMAADPEHRLPIPAMIALIRSRLHELKDKLGSGEGVVLGEISAAVDYRLEGTRIVSHLGHPLERQAPKEEKEQPSQIKPANSIRHKRSYSIGGSKKASGLLKLKALGSMNSASEKATGSETKTESVSQASDCQSSSKKIQIDRKSSAVGVPNRKSSDGDKFSEHLFREIKIERKKSVAPNLPPVPSRFASGSKKTSETKESAVHLEIHNPLIDHNYLGLRKRKASHNLDIQDFKRRLSRAKPESPSLSNRSPSIRPTLKSDWAAFLVAFLVLAAVLSRRLAQATKVPEPQETLENSSETPVKPSKKSDKELN